MNFILGCLTDLIIIVKYYLVLFDSDSPGYETGDME